MKFLPFDNAIRNFPPRPDESMVHLAYEDIVNDLRKSYYSYTEDGIRIQHHDQLHGEDQLQIQNEPSSTFDFLLDEQVDKTSIFYKSMAKLRDKVKRRDCGIIVGKVNASKTAAAQIVDISELKVGDFVAVYAQQPSHADRNKKAIVIWGSNLGFWLGRVEHLYKKHEARRIAASDRELYAPGEAGPIAKVTTLLH
jgi:hypothetical protein